MSRWLCMQQIRNDFRMSSAWIPTSENTLADSLSRYGDPVQRENFQQYCQSLDQAPKSRHVSPEHFKFKL